MPNLQLEQTVIEVVSEVVQEAEAFHTSKDSTHNPNGGNQAWLEIRRQARAELIEHLKHTFGGLK